MSLFVYAPTIRKGTNELMEALEAKRLTRFDGMRFVIKGRPVSFDDEEDVIICWGGCVPQIGKMRIFNKSLHFSNPIQMNKNLLSIKPMPKGWTVSELVPSTAVLTPGDTDYYISDANYGNIVPQRDFPGYAQPYYSLKHEYQLVMMGDTVAQASKKVATLKTYNPDHTRYDPKVHAHRFYKTEETGWKWDVVTNASVPNLCKVAANIMKQTELDFAVLSVGCPDLDGYNSGYGYNMLRKIELAPELDTVKTVENMVSIIKTWIAGGK